LRDRARDPAAPSVHGVAPVRARPSSNPLRRGFDALRQKGYKLVDEIAKLLGVSENTVRRMEAEGLIPKARRVEIAQGKCVRAFTAKAVERIVRSRAPERWRAKHPGRWVRA
jgi:predicted ArsR family transcriptional regulator